MGVSKHNIPRETSERVDNMTTDELDEFASKLGIDVSDAPDSDLYDWYRQRIYDHLANERTPAN